MRAFTFAEVIVVVSVTALLGMTINSLIFNFYRSNAYLVQQTSAIDSAHRGLRTSFEELRQATYGEDGSYPILSAATSSITFYSDVDNDGSVEKIRIYLTGTTFYRGITEATSTPATYTGQTEKQFTIANYVRNSSSTPIFKFYDEDGVQLATTSPVVADISTISISLMVDLNPFRAPDILTLQESATLRNLR
jgi:hypothetical protein